MQKQQLSDASSDDSQTSSPHQEPAREPGKSEKLSDDLALDGPVADGAVIPDEAAYEYLTGFKLVLVMSTVSMVAFLILLDSAIIATAIPKITTDFHSIPDIGWYASAYLLSNCSLQPLSGKLYKHFSSKYTFLAFLAVFELGSLLCGVAVSSKMLIVGRAVAGMGGSGLTNGALTIITASVPLKKRPALLGGLMSVAQLGTVLGPLIGGALTQYTTWRWCRFGFFSSKPQSLTFSHRLLHQPARRSGHGSVASSNQHTRPSSEGREEIHGETDSGQT